MDSEKQLLSKREFLQLAAAAVVIEGLNVACGPKLISPTSPTPPGEPFVTPPQTTEATVVKEASTINSETLIGQTAIVTLEFIESNIAGEATPRLDSIKGSLYQKGVNGQVLFGDPRTFNVGENTYQCNLVLGQEVATNRPLSPFIFTLSTTSQAGHNSVELVKADHTPLEEGGVFTLQRADVNSNTVGESIGTAKYIKHKDQFYWERVTLNGEEIVDLKKMGEIGDVFFMQLNSAIKDVGWHISDSEASIKALTEWSDQPWNINNTRFTPEQMASYSGFINGLVSLSALQVDKNGGSQESLILAIATAETPIAIEGESGNVATEVPYILHENGSVPLSTYSVAGESGVTLYGMRGQVAGKEVKIQQFPDGQIRFSNDGGGKWTDVNGESLNLPILIPKPFFDTEGLIFQTTEKGPVYIDNKGKVQYEVVLGLWMKKLGYPDYIVYQENGDFLTENLPLNISVITDKSLNSGGGINEIHLANGNAVANHMLGVLYDRALVTNTNVAGIKTKYDQQYPNDPNTARVMAIREYSELLAKAQRGEISVTSVAPMIEALNLGNRNISLLPENVKLVYFSSGETRGYTVQKDTEVVSAGNFNYGVHVENLAEDESENAYATTLVLYVPIQNNIFNYQDRTWGDKSSLAGFYFAQVAHQVVTPNDAISVNEGASPVKVNGSYVFQAR